MKIAIAQMRVRSNRPDINYETMQRLVKQSEGAAEIIVFPEMCVGGYFVADQYVHEDFQSTVVSYNEKIKGLSQDIGIIWGNVEVIGDKIYNAAFFAYKGEMIGIQHKHLLPTYGVFDDKRYFTPGSSFKPFDFKGLKIGIQICEDLWDSKSSVSPTQEALRLGADCIINISCSPWVRHKEAARTHEIVRQNSPVPFIYVNSVGVQNTGKSVILMDGNSQVVHGNKMLHLSDSFEEELRVVDLENIETCYPEKHHKLYKGLLTAIRYFDEELLSYGPKWVIGVSGGLDSSVSVALLCQALGKERVVGVTMPSQFTRDITKSNAYHLSRKLGFKFHEIPIGEMALSTVNGLHGAGYEHVEGLAYENIQARLRGHTLMSVSSLENGVVVNNGNKIEIALGYATLYGDAIGALSVLGDLTKLEVGELARSINDSMHEEIVPENLIPKNEGNRVDWEFAPSAELKDNQFDPMKWGYHDHLVVYLMTHSSHELLERYLDGSIYSLELGKYLDAYGLDNPQYFIDDLEWVLRLMRQAVYKRIQMPPIVLVSELGFGSDYRESQLPLFKSQRYETLKAKILAQ